MGDDAVHQFPGHPGHGGVRVDLDMEPAAWITTGRMLVADGEAMILRGVAALIDRAAPAPADPDAPGSSRSMSPDADGADRFPEFLVEEVAALMGLHDALAWGYLTDVALLRPRHPRAWAAVLQGRARALDVRRVARMVADAGLSQAAARRIDDRLPPAWDALPWPRIRRRTAGLIKVADPEAARRRAAEARRSRYVGVAHHGDGTSQVFARISTGAAADLDALLNHLAGQAVAEGATAPIEGLRVEAFESLVRPMPAGRAPAGQAGADLVIHMAAEDLPGGPGGTGVARVDARGPEIGPILVGGIAELLEHRRVRVVPVVDLNGDPQADSYEIPDRIRLQVGLRDPYSAFPYSSRRARFADLDHTRPWRPDGGTGQTRSSNLAPLSRHEHRAKHHGGWTVTQDRPGALIWTSPSGDHYKVSRGYTIRLPRRL